MRFVRRVASVSSAFGTLFDHVRLDGLAIVREAKPRHRVDEHRGQIVLDAVLGCRVIPAEIVNMKRKYVRIVRELWREMTYQGKVWW